MAPYAKFPLAAGGATVNFATRLLVDKDVDGTNDCEWYSGWNNNVNGTDQVRTYRLHGEMYRFDWEDLYADGEGDFNDYTALLEARTCGKLPYPIASVTGDVSLSCMQDCPQHIGCIPGTVDSSSMKFHIAIGVDDEKNEFRETRGRTLHLTVTTYVAGSKKGRKFAVCPRLWISPEPGAIVSDGIQRVFYGADPGLSCLSPWNDDISGKPVCGFMDSPNTVFNVYPVSLARAQRYARDSCRLDPPGRGDTFILPGNQTECEGMWGAHVETYELVLSEVDAALSSPSDRLSHLTAEEILERIAYVALDVIQDVSGEFYCPAGVNVWMHRVNDNVGYDTHISFDVRSSHNVTKYVRQ